MTAAESGRAKGAVKIGHKISNNSNNNRKTNIHEIIKNDARNQ